MLPAHVIEETLAQFSGTEKYHQYNGLCRLTDGALYLFTSCEAFWLTDLIVSYQPEINKTGNQRLQEFQIWDIEVNLEQESCVVTCKEDSDIPPVVTEVVPYTDFPLKSYTLYYIDRIILLPSEY